MRHLLLHGLGALLALAPSTDSGARPSERRSTDARATASLREAFEAARHAVLASADGHLARNPGQRWTTRFDGRGFTVTPDKGGWTWGLELVRWGREGSERESAGTTGACADGENLEVERDPALVEWYVNDARGLEHGFTLRERPAGEGPLRFELAVRGPLRAELEPDALGARFADASGAPALTYSGLAVLDADGTRLPARFELAAGALVLSLDDRGARYPLTIDPIAQQAYLKASNTGAGDGFGSSLALSGDTAVVGARAEDSSAVGVNGDQSNNGAPDSGAAYVFVRSGSTWSQEAYLKASNTDAADRFGGSVAIDGDTIVVGAANEDSGATGVNGDQSDDGVSSAGAAYVFVRSGSTWSQEAYLKASNPGADDRFGGSVAIDGDTIVVGADGEDSSATGVDGDQTSNAASGSGAAYVFVRSGATWSQEAYLKASNTGSGDRFGESVGISGDTSVIGARLEDSAATGVDGDGSSNGASDSGAAYVFVRSGSTWTPEAYLKASNTDSNDHFGISASISGDTVLVSAYQEDGSATGVNGDDSDDGALEAGAAYVFVRSGSTWSQQAYLKATNTASTDLFGWSVALYGDTALVGALWEDSSATGVDANQASNADGQSGAAYLFFRSGASWSPLAYLKASNTDANDWFGFSVALDGDTALVGSYQEDSSATGVDGDGGDNGAADSGAAYVFDLAASGPFAPFCFGSAAACPCANTGYPVHGCDNSQGTGGIKLSATGTPALNDVVLHGSSFPPAGTPGVVVMRSPSIEAAPLPFGDGARCVSVAGLVRLAATNASGGSSLHPLNHGAGPGLFHYQLWYRNTPASYCTPSAFNLSNGVSITWP